MAETLRVIRDYIGASEADQINAISPEHIAFMERINARCEAKDEVIAAVRTVMLSSTYRSGYIGHFMEWYVVDGAAWKELYNALAALDALPAAWQDDTAKVRVEAE